MRHPTRSLISLIAVAMFIGGCGGSTDADVQVQRYIDTVTPIFEEAKAANEALDKEIPAPSAVSELGDAKRWFDRVIEDQDQLIGALGGVGDPGAELKEAHNDYLAAESEFLALNRRIRDRLADAGSDFNMADLGLDPELGIAPQNRLGDLAEDACEKLERIARENAVSADLGCADIYR